MKKLLSLIFAVLFLCIIAYAQGNPFADALKDCKQYKSNGSVTVEGVEVFATKEILGWQNNKCVYKENLYFSGANACVTCKFTQSQIAELAGIINAYETLSEYSDSNDAESVESAKNSPVVKAWNNYLQNPHVCKTKMQR